MTEAKCETVSNEAVPNETGTVDPKDVFRNRFTYLCYELYHYRTLPYWYLALCISIMTSTLGFYYGDRKDKLIGLAILCVFFSVLIGGIICFLTDSYSLEKLNQSSQLKLCEEVITNKPVFNMKSWSKICQNMNNLLYEKGEWPTPYFFYDGRLCYNFFDSNIVEVYSGTLTASTNSDSVELPIDGNSTQNETAPAKKTNPVEEEPIRNYYRKATAVHLQSINDYNKARYAQFNL